MLKFVLLILDGFGLREEAEGNAALLAPTPNLDHLFSKYPMIPLKTSGRAVGLPDGVMGNSEVGHMNIGAGRIVKQNLVRINDEIQSGAFRKRAGLIEQLRGVAQRGGAFHVMGLCSDGGVHSHMNHLRSILELAGREGVREVYYHAFMDGRDTSPKAGQGYLRQIQQWMEELGVGKIATVVGRYYAMDRDNRWDRNEKAYRMLVHGEGEPYATAVEAIEASYAQNIGDEFVLPKIIGDGARIKGGDALLAMNFRADRMRQLIKAFHETDFSEFPVESLDIDLRTMTQYDENFTIPTLFPPENLTHTFPEILSRAGYRQLRLAETEKYAHVTYFFNGGVEDTFAGEDRLLVPSPKVATYDLQPSMSVVEVADKAVAAIKSGQYDCLICNLANPDMVGHTGILKAGMEAMEVVDRSVGRIWEAAAEQGGALFLTADHGNIEMMIDPATGEPHTAHTTLDVPFLLAAPVDGVYLEGIGKLADIAPTILTYLELEIPREMTGENHLVRNLAQAGRS